MDGRKEVEASFGLCKFRLSLILVREPGSPECQNRLRPPAGLLQEPIRRLTLTCVRNAQRVALSRFHKSPATFTFCVGEADCPACVEFDLPDSRSEASLEREQFVELGAIVIAGLLLQRLRESKSCGSWAAVSTCGLLRRRGAR